MATIKSYTDIEQSRKLANILPIETADAIYPWRELIKDYDSVYVLEDMSDIREDDIPCWSLAALLGVLPDVHLKKYIYENITKYYATLIGIRQFNSKHYDNPVDACYDAILKLKEKKLL